jgi:putative membrane protein
MLSRRNRLTAFVILALAALLALSVQAFAHHGGGGPGGPQGGKDPHGQWGGDRHRGPHGWHHGWRNWGQASAYDEQFLKHAIEGNLAEIATGNLALQKSQTPSVRELANRLVTDHTAALAKETDLANHYGIEVPDSPSPVQQWIYDQLSGQTGQEFDQSFATLEVADHQEDIEMYQDEVEHGSARPIRKTAAALIPVLQQHLQLAQAAADATD